MLKTCSSTVLAFLVLAKQRQSINKNNLIQGFVVFTNFYRTFSGKKKGLKTYFLLKGTNIVDSFYKRVLIENVCSSNVVPSVSCYNRKHNTLEVLIMKSQEPMKVKPFKLHFLNLLCTTYALRFHPFTCSHWFLIFWTSWI